MSRDSWLELRRLTPARIALGRSGASQTTREVLAFDLAHAQARDAVLTPLDVDAQIAAASAAGWAPLRVRSRAPDRTAYLVRPDWGRRLLPADAQALAEQRGEYDLLFVIGDGLSSTAVQAHALPLLEVLRPMLEGLRLAPLVIATQARVALADEVGEQLGARMAVMLIGERPGLSAADSLGIYSTYAPCVGRNDGERNCISNVRPEGLSYGAAALQLAALIRASLRAQLSGVALRFDPARALTDDPGAATAP